MKLFCRSCGVHFPDQFEETMDFNCTFWIERGLETLPSEDKQEIWDHMFAYDVDDLFVRTGIQLRVGLSRDYDSNLWEKNFTGYTSLSDDERKEFQRYYYRMLEWPNWKYRLWFWYARLRIFAFKMGVYKKDTIWMRAIRRSSSAG